MHHYYPHGCMGLMCAFFVSINTIISLNFEICMRRRKNNIQNSVVDMTTISSDFLTQKKIVETILSGLLFTKRTCNICTILDSEKNY